MQTLVTEEKANKYRGKTVLKHTGFSQNQDFDGWFIKIDNSLLFFNRALTFPMWILLEKYHVVTEIFVGEKRGESIRNPFTG